MYLKPGVNPTGIKSEMLLATQIAGLVWRENGQRLVITSITDGTHSKYSRHYLGYALDFRTRYFSDSIKRKVGRELRKALGKFYFVKVESTHIHVSFRPHR